MLLNIGRLGSHLYYTYIYIYISYIYIYIYIYTHTLFLGSPYNHCSTIYPNKSVQLLRHPTSHWQKKDAFQALRPGDFGLGLGVSYGLRVFRGLGV